MNIDLIRIIQYIQIQSNEGDICDQTSEQEISAVDCMDVLCANCPLCNQQLRRLPGGYALLLGKEII